MPTPILITAQELAAGLQKTPDALLVVDCRYALTDPSAGAQAYAQGHIPAAVYADLGELMSGPLSPSGFGGRHPLPDPHLFAQGMAALGAHDTTHIVAYDAHDGIFAARLWWLLRWIGHDKVSVLDGGLPAWQTAGGALSSALPQRPQGRLSVHGPASLTRSFEQIRQSLETHAYQLLDARGADRFRGENETMDPVGGHIPGALNRPYKDNLDATGRFKPAAQLRNEYQNLLRDTPLEQVVHQCGSGVSACHNLLAMEIAGLPGSLLYPGSWSEWCRQADAPVART